MNTCHNIPEKSSTTKINGHTPCRYSLFTHCLFDTTKNKLAYHRGKNSMKNFCLDLREHATKTINYKKKKEMTPLINEEKNFIVSKTFVIYAKIDLVLMITIKDTIKSGIIAITKENIQDLLIIFVI